ncbi:45406_t:CDS:2, partial [Gigaspora margarita]
AVKVRSRVQRTSYKASEKFAVIQEAKKIGILATSHRFDINYNQCVGAGRVSFYLAAEEELVRWLNELRQIEIAVTAGSIKMQMTTILSTTCANKYPGASQQFHASRFWFYWFLKRYYLSLRRHTKISQKLSKDLTNKLIEFHKFVIRSRSNYQYDLSQIGLTLIIQPLDMSINKSFKDRLKKKWHLWISNSKFQLTKQGNLKRPSYEVWNNISAEMIIKLFKKCSISNELDGTEDDLLYSSDKKNSEVDNNKDLLEIVEEDSLSANELELED